LGKLLVLCGFLILGAEHLGHNSYFGLSSKYLSEYSERSGGLPEIFSCVQKPCISRSTIWRLDCRI